MLISIVGVNFPGREFCRSDGSPLASVHVGIQVRREPADLVPADAEEATWTADTTVVSEGDQFDFKGPAIQGKRGERFLYLTWGNVGATGEFEMFRRAKLMLNRVDDLIMSAAVDAGHLTARVDMTGRHGQPISGRIDPPAIEWSAGTS